MAKRQTLVTVKPFIRWREGKVRAQQRDADIMTLVTSGPHQLIQDVALHSCKIRFDCFRSDEHISSRGF